MEFLYTIGYLSMEERSEFYLNRIGITEKFQLKFGENGLGRCETNDVITKSVYASRKHCIIVVDRADKIAVKINDVS